MPLEQLRASREKNPQLTYLEFWKELEHIYDRDLPDRHRREWEALSIRHLPQITLRDLRSFQAKFDKILARVGPLTDSEVAAKFLVAMPPETQQKIYTEDMRRQRNRFWVRISKPCPLTRRELMDWVSDLAEESPKIEEGDLEFFVDCKSEPARDKLLACHGVDIDGTP